MKQSECNQEIGSIEELNTVYAGLEKKCQQIEDFEDPGSTFEDLIARFVSCQKFIAANQLFSENESAKDINTEVLKFLTLPYHIGTLYGRISQPRKQAVEQSRNYLKAYLGLIETFSCEDENLFPQSIKKTWESINETGDYTLQREQVISNHKEKKQIESRYANNLKIQEHSDQRQSIKDYIMLKVYEAVTQLRNIEQEVKILDYKASLEKDPEQREKHEQEFSQPVPKMKVWQIQQSEQIQQGLVPPSTTTQTRQQLVAQVWQENANKPTMTLEEVAKLEYDNMVQRSEREKKQKEANQVDTDSDKEEVDDRQKKEARRWDDWKDAHEKGAGNRNGR